VALQLRNLTLAYLDDKLTPVQIANATFTISDLSGMGVSSFFPLISEDQGGILGVGAEQFAPGSEYGSFTLTLTFDHQLTDGRGAALFLNDLKERLSNYEKITEDRQDYLACSQCGRPEPELVDKRQNLLRSVVPQGYLCTLCVAGY
jgi:pyruvate/2-oxoglutarate dehydrogenase complex dihydrolipoamide acyltransferase (E2) component